MSRHYSLDRSALLKILLHSLKFPTTSVNGFLLGEETSAAAGQTSSSSTGASRVLHIYDAIPVGHNFLTLTMPLETALSQLQEHCKWEKKLTVVGYYQCNERLEDSDLGDVGRKVAGKVETVFPGSIALVMDSKAVDGLLKDSSSSPPMKLLHKDATRGWIHAPTTGAEAAFTCPTGGVADLLAAYVEEGRHRKLFDFEDHLDDISLDWLNKGLLD